MANNPQAVTMIKMALQPWQEALINPATAQQKVLTKLLQIYTLTDYGISHDANKITSIEEYRRAFPVVTYDD